MKLLLVVPAVLVCLFTAENVAADRVAPEPIAAPSTTAEKIGVLLPECVLQAIRAKFKFDRHGVLIGELGIKTIKNGAFEWYEG